MANPISISAELTYLRVRGILAHFAEASKRYRIPLALLLAIASRESRMGLALDENWTGDHGYGIGIMQIDKRYHGGFTQAHRNDDHQANIHYGAGFLASLVQAFDGDILHAVAAYNSGETRVRNAMNAGLDPNIVTTGRDYARDVIARRQVIENLLGMARVTSKATYLLPAALIGLLTYNYLKTSNL
jgi:soluble lytic murein transglycosylase-like protein